MLLFGVHRPQLEVGRVLEFLEERLGRRAFKLLRRRYNRQGQTVEPVTQPRNRLEGFAAQRGGREVGAAGEEGDPFVVGQRFVPV